MISGPEKRVSDASPALAMSVRYEADASRIVLDKRAVCEDFFHPQHRSRRKILQKFINDRFKLADCGDYSRYTSKPLRDFIRESNEGRDFFFVAAREEAVQRLADAPER